MRSGSAFVRLALGFARVDCAEWVPGRPAAGRRAQNVGRRAQNLERWTQGAGRRAPDVVKPGIHGVRTHWIPGFTAFHRIRPRGAGWVARSGPRTQ